MNEFDWTKANKYARNFVLVKLIEMAEAQEKLAGDGPLRFQLLAEQRGYAFRAAITKLSREAGD